MPSAGKVWLIQHRETGMYHSGTFPPYWEFIGTARMYRSLEEASAVTRSSHPEVRAHFTPGTYRIIECDLIYTAP